MKKIVLIISIIFLAFNAKSQITVLSNGYVGINRSNPLYSLEIGGNVHFYPNWTGMVLDFNAAGGEPTLYPDLNNYGWIGRTDRWFNHIYGTTIDAKALSYYSIYNYSDERLKENIKTIPTVLPKLLLVSTHTYNYKKSDFKNIKDTVQNDLTRTRYGFVAQELNNIFPISTLTN